MICKTRFAPSPTGMLHIGNVRTALINWLLTRSLQGIFILRLDDTDLLRSKKEYELAIKEDLTWLGINWDDSFKQSERMARYNEVKNHLIKIGRLYPCFETQNELDLKRKLMLNKGLPPIYDRASLKLTKEEIDEKIASGIKPHYRFLINDEDIQWNDLIRGPIHFKAKNLSDPIVIREDCSMTYILCSAIDDIDTNITHVLRGEDHISNTAIGIQITKSLGADAPTFGHLSLLHSKAGEISKRVGGFDIRSLKEQGIHPMAINSWLAKVGTSEAVEPQHDLESIINNFDISTFSHASVNYDFQEIVNLNHKIILTMSYLEAKDSCIKLNLDLEFSEEFWDTIKKNLNTFSDFKLWHQICFANINVENKFEDKEFLQLASSLLPKGNWDYTTWDVWIEEVKKTSKRSGKSLFMPIRNALTGRNDGPELKFLLPFIGYDQVYKRLND